VVDQTAAEFWKHIIDAMWKFQQGEGDASEEVRRYVVEQMSQKYYSVPEKTLSADLDKNFGLVSDIAEGGCLHEAGLPLKEVNVQTWKGPMRMDLAVTYRCNLNCSKCYLPLNWEKNTRELTKEEWIKIYKILWEIGVYHVTFTGGEPLLRNDIVDLVSEAEEFVTGLITNGVLLERYAEDLKRASLDYCQVTLESSKKDIHEKMTATPNSFEKTIAGIKKALSLNLQVVTNTTLTKINAGDFIELLGVGKSLGLKHMACNSLICSGKGTNCRKENGLTIPELKELLKEACEKAEKLGIELQWYSPTCYQELNPIDFGFGVKQCSAACYNMTVQPNGTILPCQSWPETVGNILADDWEIIWNSPICRKLRGHQLAPGKCLDCEFVLTCGGGCPLETPKGGIQ
jgi:radical SAM protein with 4Fe4S-binding SPASM domain